MWLILFLVIPIVSTVKYSAAEKSPVKIVTYGVPCPPSCHLPYNIEIPIAVIEQEKELTEITYYERLKKLNLKETYKIDTTFHANDHVEPEFASQSVYYPFAIQIPCEESSRNQISKTTCSEGKPYNKPLLKTTIDTMLVPACQNSCV